MIAPARALVQAVVVGFFSVTICFAQQDSSQQSSTTKDEKEEKISFAGKLRVLPAEWLIGPYIPSTRPLQPLTFRQRREVYVRQSFLTAGSYVARMFTAGIDQARGVPSEWGGGMDAYGRRFGSRYGQFVITNTLQSAGNAALGYESRYDLCKCKGFWPRSKHAIARNFYTYNATEVERRAQIPLYAGAFGAGMISSIWLPGHRSSWKEGAYAALGQAAYGSGINWVSEFAIDILRKITGRRYPKTPE
jgi:hypothetical protein